jgi:hypothetical protein
MPEGSEQHDTAIPYRQDAYAGNQILSPGVRRNHKIVSHLRPARIGDVVLEHAESRILESKAPLS